MVNLNSEKLTFIDSKITYQGLKLICEKMQEILATSLVTTFLLKSNKTVNFSKIEKLKYIHIYKEPFKLFKLYISLIHSLYKKSLTKY